jgi:hypothetical protein
MSSRFKRDIPVRKLIVLRGAGLLWQRTHPKGRSWLPRHPRWILHFNPTLVSLSNAVQAFFAKLTRRTCRCGVFRSLVDLQGAIDHYPADYDAHSKPFIWTTKPGTVVAATSRGYQTSKSIH